MSLTRPQLEAQFLAKITDALNRQNTALLVRECLNLLALHCFNLAEDELTLQQVTGLATALMGKADLINGKVPANQLPAFSTFWGAMAKASDNAQTVDQAIAAAVANLVASSPAALDTLNEFALALGNDANFSTTITNALALKINSSEKGQANGVASLDATGKVPASQLPAATAPGATVFTGLTDTPDSYAGMGGKVVKVKADATGLEFGDAAATDSKAIDLTLNFRQVQPFNLVYPAAWKITAVSTNSAGVTATITVNETGAAYGLNTNIAAWKSLDIAVNTIGVVRLIGTLL